MDLVEAVAEGVTGVAQDGYGGTDSLSGITELHLPGHGATVTGSGANELVFCFGGNSLIDMGDGSDTVRMHEIASSGFAIRQFGNTVFLVRVGFKTVGDYFFRAI